MTGDPTVSPLGFWLAGSAKAAPDEQEGNSGDNAAQCPSGTWFLGHPQVTHASFTSSTCNTHPRRVPKLIEGCQELCRPLRCGLVFVGGFSHPLVYGWSPARAGRYVAIWRAETARVFDFVDTDPGLIIAVVCRRQAMRSVACCFVSF